VNSTCASRGGTKRFWDSVKKLRVGLEKTQPSNDRPMKKPDGTLCKTPEENAGVFRDHFQQLYGRQPTFDAYVLHSLPQHETHIGHDLIPNDDEILKATRKLKDKGPGDSGISPQVWEAIVENELTFIILKSYYYRFLGE